MNFRIDSQPFIIADTQYEEFGCEDARITRIDDTAYINYSAVSSLGISTALAVTKDFVTVEKKGLILCRTTVTSAFSRKRLPVNITP